MTYMRYTVDKWLESEKVAFLAAMLLVLTFALSVVGGSYLLGKRIRRGIEEEQQKREAEIVVERKHNQLANDWWENYHKEQNKPIKKAIAKPVGQKIDWTLEEKKPEVVGNSPVNSFGYYYDYNTVNYPVTAVTTTTPMGMVAVQAVAPYYSYLQYPVINKKGPKSCRSKIRSTH